MVFVENFNPSLPEAPQLLVVARRSCQQQRLS